MGCSKAALAADSGQNDARSKRDRSALGRPLCPSWRSLWLVWLGTPLQINVVRWPRAGGIVGRFLEPV